MACQIHKLRACSSAKGQSALIIRMYMCRNNDVTHTYVYTHLSMYQFIYASIHLSTYHRFIIGLSIYLSIHLSICIYIYICICISLYIHLSVYLPNVFSHTCVCIPIHLNTAHTLCADKHAPVCKHIQFLCMYIFNIVHAYIHTFMHT